MESKSSDYIILLLQQSCYPIIPTDHLPSPQAGKGDQNGASREPILRLGVPVFVTVLRASEY